MENSTKYLGLEFIRSRRNKMTDRFDLLQHLTIMLSPLKRTTSEKVYRLFLKSSGRQAVDTTLVAARVLLHLINTCK